MVKWQMSESYIWETFMQESTMTNTSFSISGSFMYLPFLAKICLSERQCTMNSAGKILWTSEMFTFCSLPVRSETSNYLVPISLTNQRLGTYLASHSIFFKFLIIIKYPILNCNTSSCLSCFCLEHASLVLSAASMYVCLSLSRWVMPSSEPKYLNFGCKKTTRWGMYASFPKYNEGIPGNAHLETVKCSSCIQE